MWIYHILHTTFKKEKKLHLWILEHHCHCGFFSELVQFSLTFDINHIQADKCHIFFTWGVFQTSNSTWWGGEEPYFAGAEMFYKYANKCFQICKKYVHTSYKKWRTTHVCCTCYIHDPSWLVIKTNYQRLRAICKGIIFQ